MDDEVPAVAQAYAAFDTPAVRAVLVPDLHRRGVTCAAHRADQPDSSCPTSGTRAAAGRNNGGVPDTGDDFVGRAAERAELSAALAAGGGGVVLVAGEAGVGKTRLVAEALQGTARVAWGTCWQGDGVPPFWPWTQVLRSCLVLDASGIAGTTGLLLGDGAGRPGAELSRFVLFESAVEVLRSAGANGGLVVVLDDLQWADEASIRLLMFAVRALSASRVRFVGAYRDDEVAAGDALSRCIAELAGSVRHLRLHGLDIDGLASLAAAQAGPDAFGAQQLSDLHGLTGGNPFFAREVLALARGDLSGRLRVPMGVRAVIEQRLARLSNTCHDVLTNAAVLGTAFAAVDLAAVTGMPVGAVLAILDEAVEARVAVVDEATPGHFRFAHDLLRETTYQAIAPAARVRAHARAAVALEAGGAGVAAAALAHHLIGAVPLVDRTRAVEAARRAGEEAMRMQAHEEAGAWFARGLSLLRPDTDDDVVALGLLLALGEARRRGGDPPRARDAYVKAAGVARRYGRPQDLAAAALGLGAGLGGFEITMFDDVQIGLLEEALRTVEPGDSALRARLLARLSVALSFVAEDSRRLELITAAVAMARRLGDPSVLGYALAAHCDTIAGPAHSAARRAEAAEIVSLGLAAGDPQLELLGRRLLVVALLELGEMVEADAQIRAFSLTAEAVREPLYRWYVPLWRGMRALMAGRTEEATALCEEAEALGALADSVNAVMLTLTQRWVCLRVQGQLREAAALMEEKGTEVFGQLAGTYAVGALSQLHLGAPDRARSFLREFTADLGRVPMDAEWLPTMAQLAEVAAGVGDKSAAAVLDAMMAPFDGSVVVEGIGAAVYGTLGGYRAPLARLLGREEEARDLEAAATAAAERLGLASRPQVMPAPSPLRDTQHHRTATATRDGDSWELIFGGVATRVPDSKGMRDLAGLLAAPGTERHVSDLTGGDPPRSAARGRGDDVLDRRALAEYKRRIDELDTDLAEATGHHDEGRVAKLAAERDFVLTELSAAAGLGGRHRRLGDDVDRQRKAVRARLRDAIRRVEATHPDLGRHLDRAVRTGTFCAYDPEVRIEWNVRP